MGRNEELRTNPLDILAQKAREKQISVQNVEARIRRPFTDEEKEALKKVRLTAIYSLTGETIVDQIEKGRKFWHVAGSINSSLLTLRSFQGDVAVDLRPNKFYLPKSNYLALDEQLEMVDEYSHDLQRKLRTSSIEAILGQAPDYTELVFAYRDATGKRLFGYKYNFSYTRTQTSTAGSSFANVGNYGAVMGLDVYDWDKDYGDVSIYAVPLIVAK